MARRTGHNGLPKSRTLWLLVAAGAVFLFGQGQAVAQPAPDFSLNLAPTTQTLCPGQDATIDVTIGSISGYSDPVTLSVEGQPSGTTTGFSVNPVYPAGTSVLTIGNTWNALGQYTIVVVGVAPTSTHTTSVQLQFVDCRIPLASPLGLAAVAALLLLTGAGLLLRRG